MCFNDLIQALRFRGSIQLVKLLVLYISIYLYLLICMGSATICSAINEGKNTFSLEFFPPKSEKAAEQLLITAQELRELNPDFVSITYGAGGTTRETTFKYAEHLKNDFDYKVMPHLTCVGHSREEILAILNRYSASNIKTIMALRGDPPLGETNFSPHPEGFKFASELVDFIDNQKLDFEIGVGGYPEKHPEAPSIEQDIDNLEKKVAAGADFITTQLFYNNDHYFEFVKRCRSKKIECPIIPGLMIPNNLERVERFCAFCNAEFPEALKALMKAANNDREALKKIGVEWTFNQIKTLIENGAPGIHLYILNQSEMALLLYKKLKEENILNR